MSLLTQLQALITAQGNDLKFLLPGPAENTENYALRYNGTDWTWVPSAKVVVATGDLNINSTTLTDFPGLALPIRSGETWVFDVVVFALSLNSTSDLRFSVTGDAVGRFGVVNGENAVSKSAAIGAATTNIPVANGSNANADTIKINGIATANSDTSIQIQIRNNSGTNAQSFSAFSYITGHYVTG